MVQANIDNSPVSISLSGGESTSVPSGETWQVSIYSAPSSNSSFGSIRINGNGFSMANSGYDDDRNHRMEMNSVVLTSGDTVSTGSNTSAHISGFVVN